MDGLYYISQGEKDVFATLRYRWTEVRQDRSGERFVVRHDRHVRNLTTDADKAIEVAKQFVPEGAVLDGEKPELGGTKSGADPLKNQRIAFGKYNGCLVAGVAETDPDYLVWVATKGTRIEAAHRQAATA